MLDPRLGTTDNNGVEKTRRSRLRSYHVYLALAGFDVLTVAFGLYLSHNLTTIYTNSVSDNLEWAERSGKYSDLASLAAAVNAPGNDIFENHNVPAERAKLDQSLREFQRGLATLRADLKSEVEQPHRDDLGKRLTESEVALKDMVAEASLIFSFFEDGKPEQAGRRMATMDRKYAIVRRSLSDLAADIRHIQADQFQAQGALAATMQRFEYLLAGSVLLVIFGVTAYGIRLGRKMNAEASLIEAHESQFRAFSRCSPIGILSLDARRKCVFENSRWLELAGRSVGAAPEGWLKAFAPEDRPAITALVDGVFVPGAALPNSTQGIEARLCADTHSTRWVYVRCAATDAEGDYEGGAILTFEDISALKAVGLAMEHSRKQAEAANHAKSSFLANMSHSLRTPLNAIIGYSEMLEEETRDRGLDDLTSDVQKVRTAGHHLLALINDVLDISKIEAGRIDVHRERFDVGAMLEDLQTTVAPLARRNSNQLIIRCADDPGEMFSDMARVNQVLLNLLSNACKFTTAGTVELIAKRVVRNGRKWLQFAVRDTGIGLTAEQLPRLFQNFAQADSAIAGKFGGTGLGLAISRRLAQILGGDITVESTFGQGSLFTATLPVEGPLAVVESSPVPAALPVANSGGARVLVVDDDPAACDLLTRTLSRDGFNVVAVRDGRSGVETARTFKPQIITLDALMPDMDGWSVLTELKGSAQLRHIPVIMLSIVSEGRARAMDAGAADHLTKPVTPETLLSSIRKFILKDDTRAA